MNTAEAISALRDIHIPPVLSDATSSAADLTPWIALLLVPVLAWLHQRRRNAWRRDAALALDAIARAASEGRLKESWQGLSVILRRIALRLDPTPRTASLVGEAWLSRLDELFGLQCFSHGAGRILMLAPYRAYRNDPTARSDGFNAERAAILATVASVRSALPRLRRAA